MLYQRLRRWTNIKPTLGQNFEVKLDALQSAPMILPNSMTLGYCNI